MVGLFSLITAEVCGKHEEADTVFVAFSRDGWHWSRPAPDASGHRTAFLGLDPRGNFTAWNYQNVRSKNTHLSGCTASEPLCNRRCSLLAAASCS